MAPIPKSRKPKLVEIKEAHGDQIEERVKVLKRLLIKAALRKLKNKANNATR